MTDPGHIARTVLPRGRWSGPADRLRLTYDERCLRRRRLVTVGGRAVLLELPDTACLNPGDAVALDDGSLVAVEAADEPLLEVRGPELARLAWHIGYRRAPCRIEADRLLIRGDHRLADQLRGLGAELRGLTAPFLPDAAAGEAPDRTMGDGGAPGPDKAEHARAHDHADESRDGRVHPVRRVLAHISHRSSEDDPGAADSPE